MPRRTLRSAGFFGLHFDFHCGKNERRVGARTTPAMVRSVLSAVKPDYVQIDCKGHAGYSSYPTKVGNRPKDIVRDQLKIWRRVTAAAGVPLTMHYSGVWDNAAIAKHPDWACRDEKGKRDEKQTSVFGPYVDRLMIPQLIELAREWKVDAVWVDGDCWATPLDWSKWSLAAWRRRTGHKRLPRSEKDPHWRAFVEHCRDGFRAYLRRYVDAVHRACPGFEIASNWAFSSFMPEPVSARVDFLSGDFTPHQSPQSARVQGRCLMHQGKPWDLMAWGFGYVFKSYAENAKSEKSALQLCQEAALVLSLGGGFQIYTNQERDASVAPARLPVLAEVARFCRARQELCHRARSAPQIAVLNSSDDTHKRLDTPFTIWWPGMNQLEGILRLCLDARRHVDVLSDHQARGNLSRYPVVVIPECRFIADDVRREILAYLHAGGNVLAIGPHALAALGCETPIRTMGKITEGVRYLRSPNRAGGADFAGAGGDWQEWKVGNGARVLTTMHANMDTRIPGSPGAVACRIGRGRLIAVACELGRMYLEKASSVSAELVASWLRYLDPKPLVEIDGPGRVEVACMRKDGELRIHLTNFEGPHDAKNVLTWNHIPPVGPLTVRIRGKGYGPPRWEPDGVRLRARKVADGIVVEIPRLDVHGAICLSERGV